MGLPAIALAMEAGSAVAGGVQAASAAKGEQQRAEINSYIGRTRAIQTGATAREGLTDELATFRNNLAGMGQNAGVGTFTLMQELRRVRGRDQRIEVGNRNQEAADWRLAGKNAGRAATGAMVGGILKAGPSLFTLYDINRKDS